MLDEKSWISHDEKQRHLGNSWENGEHWKLWKCLGSVDSLESLAPLDSFDSYDYFETWEAFGFVGFIIPQFVVENRWFIIFIFVEDLSKGFVYEFTFDAHLLIHLILKKG